MNRPLRIYAAVVALALAACGGTRGTAGPRAGGSRAAARNQNTAGLRRGAQGMVCMHEGTPPDANLAYGEGEAADLAGDVVKAEAMYLKAIELDPTLCDAMDNLGAVYRRAGRVDDAIALYRRSLELAPSNPVALQNLGLALSIQEKYAEAAEQYGKLIELHPDNPEGHYGLGLLILHHSDETVAAIGLLEEAERLYQASGSPALADARLALGDAHRVLEHWKECKRYLEAAYEHFGGEGTVNLALGICWLADDPPDRARAREYLVRARELGQRVDDELWNASDPGK
jgi:tetratricopeptide (TPR) repeat protein